MSLKFWLGVCVVIITLLLGISYGTHQYIAKEIVNRAPKQLNQILPDTIKVHYTDLKSENCITALCVSAQNVTVTFPDTLGRFVLIQLGQVQLERTITGIYHVHSNGINTENTAIKTNPIQVKLTGSTDLNESTIKNLVLEQNQFNAQLSGTINKARQEINLEGDAVGLAQFIIQFVPQDFRFLVNLMLKDTKQEVTITSDNEWIRLLDLPIMPKKMIFH